MALSDINVLEEDLQKFENEYNKAHRQGEMTDAIRFDYAWCLVRSKNTVDIKKGITILNELCRQNTKDRRDYMYYLAIGYAHLHDYSKALDLLDQILRQEPTNHQVLSLRKEIQAKKSAETTQDVATGIGAMAIIGGIALVAFGLGKKLSN